MDNAENYTNNILHQIIKYCNQIDEINSEYNSDKSRYNQSWAYKNSLSLCIMQIGESVKRLPSNFCNRFPQIPWRKIAGMRNYVAHEYGSVDFEIVWDASQNGIIGLKAFCERYLSEQDRSQEQ